MVVSLDCRCKQIVLATIRAMFDIVDKNTKQVNIICKLFNSNIVKRPMHELDKMQLTVRINFFFNIYV